MPTTRIAAATATLLIAGTSSCASGDRATGSMFSQADAYERFMGRWSRLLAPSLVVLSRVGDGESVLDVGSGTGALAFAVRDATRTTRIIGIDPSKPYIERATASSHDPRVRFQLGDGQAIRFPDGRFDRTLSLLVMNFIPDRERAVKEMIRVTRPGGLVAAAVWDYGEGMEMLRAFWDEAIALDPASAPRDEAHMPLCKPGELAALWRRAGLIEVKEAALTVTLHFASFEDYWQPFLLGQGPAGAYVASLANDRRVELARRLRQRLLGGGPDHPFELRARAWAVTGVVPETPMAP